MYVNEVLASLSLFLLVADQNAWVIPNRNSWWIVELVGKRTWMRTRTLAPSGHVSLRELLVSHFPPLAMGTKHRLQWTLRLKYETHSITQFCQSEMTTTFALLSFLVNFYVPDRKMICSFIHSVWTVGARHC